MANNKKLPTRQITGGLIRKVNGVWQIKCHWPHEHPDTYTPCKFKSLSIFWLDALYALTTHQIDHVAQDEAAGLLVRFGVGYVPNPEMRDGVPEPKSYPCPCCGKLMRVSHS